MPTLNPDSVYQLPSREIQKSGVGIHDEELSALITAVQPHLDEASRADFAQRMQGHVGEPSTYTLKKEVREGLKVIHQHFFKPNISSSEQSAIAYKLAERAEHCTPGFHNGVNAIVDGFYLPENTDELLYRYRRELVATAANQLSDEVHAQNRCFTVAATSGFGVFPLNSGDTYAGAVSDGTIRAKLTSVFAEKMSFFPMLQSFKSQLLSLLLNAGYLGQSTEFSSEVVEKIDPLFMTLFSHHPIVQSLKTAQAAHKAQTDANTRAHHEAFENMKAFVLSHPSEFSAFDTYQRPKLDYLFTGKAALPKFKTWGDECLAKLSDADRKVFEGLKANIPPINASIEEAWKVATQQFNQYFYTQDSDGRILDVQWKNIHQLLWQAINEKQYFTFQEHEHQALAKLFDPGLPVAEFKTACVEVFKTLEHFDDFISMFELLPEMKHVLHIEDLNQYVAKNPMAYEQFKRTFTTLGSSDLGKSFARQYYQPFLSKLENDPLMPIPLFALMTPQVIHGFFSKNIDHKNLKHLLAGLAACDEAVKKQVLTQVNEDGDNALMYAVRYNAEAIAPLLEALSTYSDDVKASILSQTNGDGNNALMCAAMYNADAIAPLLEVLSTYSDDLKTRVLTQTNTFGKNALMCAAKHSPAAISLLLEGLSRYSADVNASILTKTDVRGDNWLMCALRFNPGETAFLLEALSTCSDDVKAQLLTDNIRVRVAKRYPLALTKFDIHRIITTTKSPLWEVVANNFDEYQNTKNPDLLTTIYKNAHALLNNVDLKKLLPAPRPKSIMEQFKALTQRQPSRYETMVQNVIDTLCRLKPDLKDIDLSSTDNTPKLK